MFYCRKLNGRLLYSVKRRMIGDLLSIKHVIDEREDNNRITF